MGSQDLPQQLAFPVDAGTVGPVGFASGHVGQVVNVLPDGAGRLGMLSYRVPVGLTVRPGDAVHVPLGKREAVGVALGSGDPEKATRDLMGVYGRRSTPADITFALELADIHCVPVAKVAGRLAPRTGKGATPIDAGPVQLDCPQPPAGWADLDDAVRRRFLLRAPLVDPARLAALEAARIASARSGQVLVLCPTVKLVDAVLGQFQGGARRLDRKADYGAWKGFVEGGVTIGVGTRAAALYAADRLAGIVVVEADHPGHEEQAQPITHARDVAVARAAHLGCDVSVIAATATAQMVSGRLRVLQVGDAADWPAMQLIRADHFPPGQRMPAPPLLEALADTVAAGRTAVVVAERRPSRRLCPQCGAVRTCTVCADADRPQGRCRHVAGLPPCQTCGATTGRLIGWDRDRVAAAVPDGVKVVTLAQLEKVRDAGCVVVLDIDPAVRAAALYPDSYPAGLLVRAAAACAADGQVLVGTQHPTDLLVEVCGTEGILPSVRRSWDAAQAAGLPPFGRMVTITVGWKSPPRVAGWPGRVLGPRTLPGGDHEVVVLLSPEEFRSFQPQLVRLRKRAKVRIVVT